MKVALGWKAHSGWAALVVLGAPGGEVQVVDRRRVELVEPEEARWAKQPYHAAEKAPREKGREIVESGIRSARRKALRAMRAALKRARKDDHDVVACAVLAAAPMPDWSVDEILDVHFRMHKAEGHLFRDALSRAAERSGLRLVEIPEKRLEGEASGSLAAPTRVLREDVARLGSVLGPPWGKDQKDAALAAWIALERT
jgi:hypothetical protein